MTRLNVLFLLAAAIQAIPGQQQTLVMPTWLSPYMGAEVKTTVRPGLVEATYLAPARPGAVSAHYRRLLEAASVKVLSNDNGMGISIRASPNECDVLILLQERSEGTLTQVSCAVRSQGSAGAVEYREVPASPTAAKEPRRGAVDMSKYDQPVQSTRLRQRRSGPLLETAPAAPAEAVTLAWPSWLDHMPGADRKLNVVAAADLSKNKILRSKFATQAPMTAIHKFYENLLNSNGYRVYETRLSTGSTASGMVQNRSGFVEGDYYPSGRGGGRIRVHVSFSRAYLNAPISVSLTVTTFPPKGFRQ